MPDSLFPRPDAVCVRLALPVPIDSLFDYQVPPGTPPPLPGSRVSVRFSGRTLTGVVMEVGDASFAGEQRGSVETSARPPLQTLREVIDREPVISASMLGILTEAARRTLCPVGLAVAAALPPGGRTKIVRRLSATLRGERALESGAVRGDAQRLLEQLHARPSTIASLARRKSSAAASTEELLALAEVLVRDGLLHWSESTHSPPSSRKVRVAVLAEDVDAVRAQEELATRAPKQAALLERIARVGEIETALLTREDAGAGSLIRALAKRELVSIVEREVRPDVLGAPVARDSNLELTTDQAAALDPICAAIGERDSATFLLHGVTGSGKTEVYLRAVQEALARGRQALVLVPEITLTHQIVARLRARFGDGLAILHSGLRPAERLDQWKRLREGQTPIAVGARSALFAPLENLGVIVIDEEHDSAYKNDEGFRYRAHHLAALISRAAKCPLILGSATPALETRYAAERGALQRLVLPRRIGGRPLPSVEIVDLVRERAKTVRGRKIILSHPLRKALRETLEQRGQAILFLNRRGFSTQIFCFDCGHAERCVACDVALVYHAGEHALRCHYCDYTKPPPEQCGGCGAPDSALLGVGTERLEEEVRKAFPDARLARLDRDTAARRGHTEAVLRSLTEERVDILIGTQMVAKGHDFPGVRLVGVIAADLGLHMPDFRSAERTFQLLTQVAGRAGRAGTPGRVIVQSYVPEHYAIAPVASHDYETFYAEELQHRSTLGFPPFGALAQAVISAEEESACIAAGEQLTAAVKDFVMEHGVELLGPAPAALSRLRGRHRYQLLLKSKDRRAVLAAARKLHDAAAALPRAVQVIVDVNPVNML